MNTLPYVGVFLAMGALDFAWTFYTKAIQKSAAAQSALWAGLVVLLSGACQIGYVTNPWLLIPALLGAFIGTYFGVKVQ